MALTQSKIPPQAYTRDTLVKAIEWLSHQPPVVRERANSADLIVSHYLQARRQNAAAQMEAPISQENFKADLKHLAEDLKRFEEPSAPPHQPVRSPSYNAQYVPQMQMPLMAPVQQVAYTPPLAPVAPAPAPTPAPEATPRGPVWTIDARSLMIARELQDRLNLGSETEAIRMLITMGAERAKTLFP